MTAKKLTRYLLIFILLSGLSLVISGCLNTGSRFLRDVSQTCCCFSPALVFPAGALILHFSRG